MEESKKDYLDVKYNENEKPLTDFPKKLIEYLANRFGINSDTTLLELGCGRCETLNAFSHIGLSAYGVDSSEKARTYASKSVSDVYVSDLENETLPFDSEKFDVVFSKSVIEHISNPTHLMKEISRILKPNGLLIILTPEWTSQMEVFFEDPTHVHPYQVKGLADLLNINKFEKIHSEIFYYNELLWKSSFWRVIAKFLRIFLTTKKARSMTEKTNNKFYRWSVEAQILCYGYKK